MVSKIKKFIYIHINKCAGTSMTRFLKSYLCYDSEGKIWPKEHATLQDVYNVLDEDDLENSLHQLASVYLNQNKLELAWKILLSNKT